MPIRIEVHSPQAAAARAILQGAAALGIDGLQNCTIAHLYFIEHDLTDAEIEHLCTMLLVDPVTEQARWRAVDAPAPSNEQGSHVVEVTYRPGVTDVAARELARGMAEIGINGGEDGAHAQYGVKTHLGHHRKGRRHRRAGQ